MKSKSLTHYVSALKICRSLIILSILSISVQCSSNNLLRTRREKPRDLASGDQTSNTEDDTSSSADSEDSQREPPNELSVIRFNDTSVVLRWEFNDQYFTLLDCFKVQYKSTRANSTWTTDENEIEPLTRAYQINGLRPGNHLFIVIAVYENSDSAPSKPFKYRLKAKSKISPQDMPDMGPPKIFWKEAQSDYFRFKWTYEPKASDQEDFGFLVYYRSAHEVKPFNIYNTMDTNVEIAELLPDTPYEAKVLAYNEHGVSLFSETITVRTKLLEMSTTSVSPTSSVATTLPDFSLLNLSTISPSKAPMPEQPKPSLNTSVTAIESNSTNKSIHNFKLLFSGFSDLNDVILVVRYLLLVLVPVLFVTLGLILCPKCNKGKKRVHQASTDDAQSDLEINRFFKNSFPGLEI